MTIADSELLEYARQVLGRCELPEDRSWGHQMSTVLHLRDSHGTDWFVKQHHERERYEAEVTAYRRWAPALGARAARLHDANDALQAVILSALPGTSPAWPAPTDLSPRGVDLAVHREAGRVLRQLHEAQPPESWDDFSFGAAKAEELAQLEPAAAALLSRPEMDAVRAEIQALAGVTGLSKVPCHHDYNIRNWLVDETGAVNIIDFEWARLDVWVSDLVRLRAGVWKGRPFLQEAFLDGYGRQPDSHELAALRGCGILTAVWLIIKARETGRGSFEEGNRAMLSALLEQSQSQ